MSTTRYFFVVIASLASIAGCGKSDGGNGRGRYVSGVASGQDVSTLDATQKQQLCDSFDTYVNAYVDLDAVAYVACIPGAIWTTTSVEACKTSLNNCMALFPRPITIDAKLHSDSACFADLAQCQTTVGELEGCVNVSVDRALSVLDWSCDLAGSAATRMVAEPKPDTRVCTNVSNPCNQFATVGPE